MTGRERERGGDGGGGGYEEEQESQSDVCRTRWRLIFFSLDLSQFREKETKEKEKNVFGEIEQIQNFEDWVSEEGIFGEALLTTWGLYYKTITIVSDDPK